MILRPEPSQPDTDQPLAPVVSNWLRRAVSGTRAVDAQAFGQHTIEDAALVTGAAIAALDAVVRRQDRSAGVWRQRLGLAAAAVTAGAAGRVEDEAALRDAASLTRPGDEIGPAGRLLLAWRRLATRPPGELLTEGDLAAVLEAFGYARDDEAVRDLAEDLRELRASAGVVGTSTGAFDAAERYGFGHPFGCWLADALLAQRLGWSRAIPLLGTEAGVRAGAGRRRDPAAGMSFTERAADRTTAILAGQARAALRAIDLSSELERRAEKLLAVAPKLRARAAKAVVAKLLTDDAMVASDRIAGISDRGLRRLFDRLVELGAVRELSGRSTFRIYGL
ncbi:DUF1403 family protein [Mesorhizobium sp. CAU 1732]|uniref:DUF1403 family protein n=1 Tax=Mesorhizobium sp. CAU 1732 TaxID=3140358 RepID=UPI0032610F85